MSAQPYTLQLVLMWILVVAAAYVSRSLFQSRAYRTVFTFIPIALIALLNWFGVLNVWPLSIPLPNMGQTANLTAYSGIMTGVCVFFILRLAKDQNRGGRS